MDSLKWEREHDCPWNEKTCHAAVEGGHLEVLKWARERGCPWHTNSTCAAAIEGGDEETLRWMDEEGFFDGYVEESDEYSDK